MMRPRIPRDRVVEAFALARRLAAASPPKAARGYRLFWAKLPNVSWLDLVPGEHAVLGSHERCDLVVPDEAGMRTRHALATCSLLDDGTVALRLLDLHTDLPFFLLDDEPHVSIVAAGDFAVRLGHMVVGALSMSLPATNEYPTPTASQNANQGVASPDAKNGGIPEITLSKSSRVPRSGSSNPRCTHVTSMPAPSPIGTLASGVRTAMNVADASSLVRTGGPLGPVGQGGGPSNAWPTDAPGAPAPHRLTLVRGRQAASIIVPDDVLELGLIIGRAENCEDRGLRAILDDTISRAHLLLLREAKDVVAFDLCSLNGTKYLGVRHRRLVLPFSGATLNLGQFELHWNALAS